MVSEELTIQLEDPSREQLLAELASLHQDFAALKQEKAELEELLETSQKHCQRRETDLETQGKALRETEERYRFLYDNTPVMLHSIDRHCQLIDVNNYWLKKLGYERQEVLGKKSTEFLTAKSRSYAEDVVLPEFFQTGVCQDIPYQFICKDGKIIDVLLSAFSEWDGSGQIVRSLAVLIDVTDRKQAETAIRESEESYRLLTALSPVGIWRTDILGNCTYANEKLLKLTGLSATEILGTGWAKHVHPEDRERITAIWTNFVEQSCSGHDLEYKIEYKALRRDGSIIWALGEGVPERNPEGEIVGFIGIMVDISERKEMEEALRQKEANHQAILGAVPDLMLRVRRDGTCLESILPKSASAGTFLPIEKHISEVLPPELLQKQLQAIEQTLATGEVQVYEHQIKKFDKVFDEEVRISPLAEEEVLILVCDISLRKQAEREIDRLFSLSPDLLCIANFEGYFLRLNPVWEKILGYTHPELMATPYLEFVHPDDRGRTLAQAEKIAKGATVIEFENRYRCRDGSYRWLLWMAAPFVETGTIYCVAHDITDRKETEIALQQSEQRLNLALSAADAGVWDWNMQTDETSYSNHLSTLFGMSHDAFDGKYETFFSLVYPEDRKAVKQAVRQAIEKGISYDIEFRVVWADGSLHWIGSRGKVFYDETGRPLRMIGVDKDISKRKQAEEALRLAEENYRSIFENALEGIFQSTPEGQYIRVNPAMARIHGYESPEEMITMVKKIDRQIYVHPQTREEFLRLMAERGEVKEFQYQARRADGRIIWLEENTRTVDDCGGNLLYYEGIIQDITQRKQEEQALKRNVEKLIIEIDQQRRQREVAEIMQTDYFQELQAQVDKLRYERSSDEMAD